MTEENNEETSQDYEDIKGKIIDYLDNEDTISAFQLLRPFLDYPGKTTSETMWIDVLSIFKTIANALGGDKFAQLVQDVIDSPENITTLYNLAYELYEEKLFSIAATILLRANNINPDDAKIVTELVANLEALMLNGEASRILTESKILIESDDFCKYLLAFNSLMTGNLDLPSEILPKLLESTTNDIQFMASQIKGMLNRASALKEISQLDKKDLRGWHMVLNGSILLHLSPFGFEDAMFGRYAYVFDSYTLIKDGINRLKAILSAADVKVPAIIALPDRSSQILALATSRLLDIPLKDWNDIDINTPGLIVAYDLDEVRDEVVLKDISEHRPDQILWAHASPWVNPFPYSPDITTFLYQTNNSPWGGGGMGYNLKEKRVTTLDKDISTEEEIVEKIIEEPIGEEYLKDLNDLIKIIEPLKSLNDKDLPGIFKKTGKRIRQREGSPVQSNQF